MDKSTLQQALEHVMGADHLCPYSGRGMYGRECLAIERDFLLADGARLMQHAITKNMDIDALLKDMEGACSDSLGMGVITYWPHVPFVEEDS